MSNLIRFLSSEREFLNNTTNNNGV